MLNTNIMAVLKTVS